MRGNVGDERMKRWGVLKGYDIEDRKGEEKRGSDICRGKRTSKGRHGGKRVVRRGGNFTLLRIVGEQSLKGGEGAFVGEEQDSEVRGKKSLAGGGQGEDCVEVKASKEREHEVGGKGSREGVQGDNEQR